LPRLAPLAAVALVLVIGPLVAACDALETFELFDTKKKLPGERKPVFPEGIPGVQSGIPAELVKGHHEYEHADVTDPAKVAAEAAASTPKPKPLKPPPAPKPAATASTAPPRPAKPPTQSAQSQPAPQSTGSTTAAAPPQPSGAPQAIAPQPWPGQNSSGTPTRWPGTQ
jgi:hypothetical protein